MVIKKRCLLWDWTNSDVHTGEPKAIDIPCKAPLICSVSNWNAWKPPELNNRLPFRPMVRVEASLSGVDWSMIASSNEPIIHFFNEPERAGITPEQAAEAWQRQMLPLRQHKGKKLVSPSCSNDEAGQTWITEFMNLVSANPPDFLGLHYYGTEGNDGIKFIWSMHEKHPHQPIIVTEIASISRNYNDVLGFTAQLANWMDQTPWIFEYGFFGCMRKVADSFVSPEAQLMKPDGTFTDLMYKLMYAQPIKA